MLHPLARGLEPAGFIHSTTGGTAMSRAFLTAIAAASVILGPGSSRGAEAPDPFRFIVIPKVVHPWYEQVEAGAREQAQFLEAQTGKVFHVDYRAPERAEAKLQNRLLEQALAEAPDGIAIDLLDPDANRPFLQAVLDRNIPLVLFDSESPPDLALPSIGNDFGAQGRMAAERLVQLMGGSGKVAIMQGVPTAPNHRIRFEAHKAVFARHPGIQVVAEPADHDDIAIAEQEARKVLEAHPDLAGFVSCNASGPIGIGRAIAAAGRAGTVHSVGIDDLEALLELIRAGVVDSSLSTKPKMQGSWAITSLWMARMGRPLPQYIDTGIAHVTRDGLDGYVGH
jgi:ribose transport system substrate-binding protein